MNTRPPILTEGQRRLIRESAARITKADNWVSEIKKRHDVSGSFRTLITESGVLDGRSITSDHLAEIIRLQWKIQNLNAVTLPRLIGTYGYYRHFKNYSGTREDFPGYLTRRKESWSPDNAGYRGVDLDLFSRDLRALLSSEGDSFVLALDQILTHPGVGRAFATGLLLLYAPERYPLVNSASCASFDENGACPLTKEQKKQLRRTLQEIYPGADAVVPPSTLDRLSWMLVLEEVRGVAGLADFLEVDWLLWNWTKEKAGGATSPETKQRGSDPNWLAGLVASVEDAKRIDIRRAAEEKARRVIQQNLDELTQDRLFEIARLLNADLSQGKARKDRFSNLFLAHWNRNVRADSAGVARWIARFWRASEDEIGGLLDECTQSRELVGRLSVPSAILYLRDPERFNFCTWKLQDGLEKALGRRMQKSRSSQSYAEFNRGIKELRDRFNLPPQVIDLLLIRATEGESMAQANLPDERTAVSISAPDLSFGGFREESFRFMKDLSENNSTAWFQKNKQRFNDFVRTPFQKLVDDLGRLLISRIAVPLEYAPKFPETLSAIRKNIWAKKDVGGYWSHYWAAFHRASMKKTEDFQLFFSIKGEFLTYGMSFGSASEADITRFKERVQQSRDQVTEYIGAVHDVGLQFVHTKDSVSEGLTVKGAEDLAKALDTRFRLDIHRRVPAADAVRAGAGIAAEIVDAFRALMPLYLVAVAERPDEAIAAFFEEEPEPDIEEYPMDSLVEDTSYSSDFFTRIEALLEEKPQVVFSGPPGTGKTYVAERFARYLAKSGDRVETVQFHPSYGYEDFIEGLRPVPGEGQVRYEVVPGIFRRLCDRARRQPENKFVLIVDEMNRGNLPRIFGELLLLLERRGQKARLPYSHDEFMIPPNLYLIGTMNTADHSIALVDFALRRRFHFVDFQPDAEILRQWLEDNVEGMEWVARFMTLINAALQERNVDPQWAIGHTHFMHPQLDDERLERIWDHSIRPTLDEYFYGDPKSLKYFDYEALTEKARQMEAAESEEDEDDIGAALSDGSPPA